MSAYAISVSSWYNLAKYTTIQLHDNDVLSIVALQTDMVVASPRDDIMVADVVDCFNDYIAAMPHHVVVCLTVFILPQWVVHCRTIRFNVQARSAAAAVTGKDCVAAAVVRTTFNSRAARAKFGIAETGRTIKLYRGKAGTFNHHLADHLALLPYHLTCTIINTHSEV